MLKTRLKKNFQMISGVGGRDQIVELILKSVIRPVFHRQKHPYLGLIGAAMVAQVIRSTLFHAVAFVCIEIFILF